MIGGQGGEVDSTRDQENHEQRKIRRKRNLDLDLMRES